MIRLALVLALAGCASTSATSGPPAVAPIDDGKDEPPEIQSNDILARDARTSLARVKHVLIGWRELGDAYPSGLDPRAEARSREEADALALALLARVRAGEDIDALMREHSEDKGSAEFAGRYTVTPDASLVFEFKRLSLRLEVGEVGLVKTDFGWHIIKRIE
jgi:hypothetical protein